MTNLTQAALDEMRKNPDHYFMGLFYYNPKDPRIILPKMYRWMGWTLNFAKPAAYLILAVLLLLIFAVPYFYSK